MPWLRNARVLLTALTLVGVCVGLGSEPRADAGPKDDLDKKALSDLAARWMQARPLTAFGHWDLPTRNKLLEEARALGEPPEGSLDEIVALLWKAVQKHGPRAKKDEFESPYGRAWWIRSGKGGPKSGLILGLHGGGVGAGSASEAAGKWKLPKTMQMYPQGIRLVHDTWNSVHGERFLLTLIEIAKAQYDIDPDRVYSMGFSMGGSGSFFMAGRHPDLLAGAIPAHGVVPADKVKEPDPAKVGRMEHGLIPNLRNVPVYFYTGSIDVNCEPGTFLRAFQMIEELRKEDRGGYEQIEFACHEGVAHTFPAGEPGKGYKWIEAKRRDAFPTKIVWHYNEAPWPPGDAEDAGKATRLPKRWMYWLHCTHPVDYMEIVAARSATDTEHVIDVEAVKVFPEDLTIYLNDRMADPAREVVVRVAGEEVYRGKPARGYDVIFESLDARLDRTLVFDRRVRIPEKR
ncbi:MAG: dienelactone hydrolase family protein [Planctomycetota bacterium]|nr:dienelactone hydrolase family protein [Planctomycetota bacterium]